MNKTKLITLMLVGTFWQNAFASDSLIQTIDPETGEVIFSPNPHLCPNAPDCGEPPIQELATEEDEADNG